MGQHRVIGGAKVALTFTASSVVSSGSDNPFTLTSVAIGAAGKRHVVVAVWTSGEVVTGCTIGGVTATLIHSYAVGDLCIFGAEVPTGTTANIVLSAADLMGSVGYAVWAVYNLKSLTPIDTITNSSAVAGGTLTTKPRGCAFALATDVCPFDEGPGSFSMSGMTIDAQPTRLGPPNYRLMFASALTTTTSLAYSTAPISNSTGTNDQIISVSLR